MKTFMFRANVDAKRVTECLRVAIMNGNRAKYYPETGFVYAEMMADTLNDADAAINKLAKGTAHFAPSNEQLAGISYPQCIKDWVYLARKEELTAAFGGDWVQIKEDQAWGKCPTFKRPSDGAIIFFDHGDMLDGPTMAERLRQTWLTVDDTSLYWKNVIREVADCPTP